MLDMRNTKTKRTIAAVVAIVLIVGFIYMLFRPYKESNTLKVKGMVGAK